MQATLFGASDGFHVAKEFHVVILWNRGHVFHGNVHKIGDQPQYSWQKSECYQNNSIQSHSFLRDINEQS